MYIYVYIRRAKLFVILAGNQIKTQNFSLLFQNVGAVHPFINLNNNLAFAKLLWVPVELHTVVASNSPEPFFLLIIIMKLKRRIFLLKIQQNISLKISRRKNSRKQNFQKKSQEPFS